MKKIWLSLKHGKVHCYQLGSGPRLVIALHGFAHSGASFQTMGLGDGYTVYAPDLPFHGLTEWHADAFDQQDFKELVEAILALNPGQPFYWLGYSLGGRLVLSEWKGFAPQLAGLILIAPDGLGSGVRAIPHRMPLFLRQWLCGLLERPNWFLKWSRFLKKVGIIDHFSDQYLHKNLGTTENRRRLLGTWKSVSHFKLKQRKAPTPNFPIFVVLGRRDRIIMPEVIHPLKKCFPKAVVIWRDCGHQLINRETGIILRKQLNKEPD